MTCHICAESKTELISGLVIISGQCSQAVVSRQWSPCRLGTRLQHMTPLKEPACCVSDELPLLWNLIFNHW